MGAGPVRRRSGLPSGLHGCSGFPRKPALLRKRPRRLWGASSEHFFSAPFPLPFRSFPRSPFTLSELGGLCRGVLPLAGGLPPRSPEEAGQGERAGPVGIGAEPDQNRAGIGPDAETGGTGRSGAESAKSAETCRNRVGAVGMQSEPAGPAGTGRPELFGRNRSASGAGPDSNGRGQPRSKPLAVRQSCPGNLSEKIRPKESSEKAGPADVSGRFILKTYPEKPSGKTGQADASGKFIRARPFGRSGQQSRSESHPFQKPQLSSSCSFSGVRPGSGSSPSRSRRAASCFRSRVPSEVARNSSHRAERS